MGCSSPPKGMKTRPFGGAGLLACLLRSASSTEPSGSFRNGRLGSGMPDPYAVPRSHFPRGAALRLGGGAALPDQLLDLGLRQAERDVHGGSGGRDGQGFQERGGGGVLRCLRLGTGKELFHFEIPFEQERPSRSTAARLGWRPASPYLAHHATLGGCDRRGREGLPSASPPPRSLRSGIRKPPPC